MLLYAIQRLQAWFPFNPQGYGAGNVSPDLGFNTSVSFVTNTNWQGYVPETTLSYFVQMAGLTMHNFTSAAAGLAIAIALVRGFARQSVKTIGNFWADMTRATLYVLLPISIIAALVLCSQGVIQNLHPYTVVTTLEGAKQTIAQGPVASQEAIKMLGTNGGGFFNANSSHPFENPTPFSNMFQMFLIFLIPGALTYTFGKMVRDTRQGWAIFVAMAVLWFGGVFVAYHYEQKGTPMLAKAGIEMTATDTQPGGNMEGKETRFGIANSALFATVTTDASCGAVNAMHDSFTPLGGLVPLFNIELGEVVFGGVGAGLYGMLMFAILAVFIAGLMVGRTPEYLGKKIEQKEVKMAMIAMLVLAASILLFAGASSVIPFAAKGYWNPPGRGRGECQQPRRAWVVRDPLRLLERDRKQRQRLRRHQREYALVQPDHRIRHADRAVSDASAVARDRRLAGRKEAGSRFGGNVPHARTAVRGIAGGSRDYRRRPDLLSRFVAGTDRRTLDSVIKDMAVKRKA